MPAAGVVTIVAVVLIVLALVYYLVSTIVALRRIADGLDEVIANVGEIVAKTAPVNDVVLAVAPRLIAAPLAWITARVTGAKCWLHVQDFEVEAAFATGLMDERGLGARLARAFQRFVFRRFDALSSISDEMCRKLESFGVDPARIHQFRNWADLDRVQPLDQPSSYRTEWDIQAPHVALYSGNIANKQGIEIVVEAARRV